MVDLFELEMFGWNMWLIIKYKICILFSKIMHAIKKGCLMERMCIYKELNIDQIKFFSHESP